MKELGKLITCDRCGKQIFLKKTGEGSGDGGWSRWGTFEELPEGWKCGVHTESLSQGFVDLCPECHKEYEKIVSQFMYNVNRFIGG